MEHIVALKPGGIIDRFKAAVVDNIYVGLVNVILTIVLLQISITTLVITIISLLIYLIYAVYMTVNKGRTFGKMAFGLTVIQYRSHKHVTYVQSLTREFMKNGLSLLPYVGLIYYVANGLSVVLSKEKRGWHDKVAGTQVVKNTPVWGMRNYFLFIFLPLLIFVFLVVHLYTRPEFIQLYDAQLK